MVKHVLRRGTCIAVVCACEKSVAISSDDTLEVATIDVEEQTCGYGQ